MRYVFGSIWVLFIGSAVAIIVGLFNAVVLEFIYPIGRNLFTMIGPPASFVLINIPGVVLGFFAARQSWRAGINRLNQIQNPKNESNTIA